MSKLFKVLSILGLIAVSIIGYNHFGWVQFFGWVYSLAFALSALPQAIQSYKQGHSNGIADGMMQLWMVGEIAGLVYGFGLNQTPILFNCALNVVFIGTIIYYRIWPRKSDNLCSTPKCDEEVNPGQNICGVCQDIVLMKDM